MKGRPPTADQKRFHDLLCREIGCIACRKDGIPTSWWVSPHHIDGRTKPWAHWWVLPLCAGHHQDGTGAPGLIPVHPWKTRFEDRYGKQPDLLRECIQILLDRGCKVPDGALRAADMKKPEPTVEVGPGGVQQVHGDEIMRNMEIVSEKARLRQSGVA